MPEVPGPFALLPDSAATGTPGVYDFEADAVAMESKVQSLVSGWDGFFSDAYSLASDPLADLEGIDFGGILGSVATGAAASDFPSLNDTAVSYDLANQQLGIALSFAPADAWRDPSAPFIPPDSAAVLTAPVLPDDAFDPATLGTVGSSLPPLRPGVQLFNLTRIGASNFVVGDNFTVLVYGAPGQAVTVYAVQDGKSLGTAAMGETDSAGNFRLDGTMAPDAVGAWQEIWYLDGVKVQAFSFIVTGSL